MSPEEKGKLSQQAYADTGFRHRLIDDPKKAAAELGIALSDDEEQEILKHANGIMQTGAKIDQGRHDKLGGPKAGGIFPFIFGI